MHTSTTPPMISPNSEQTGAGADAAERMHSACQHVEQQTHHPTDAKVRAKARRKRREEQGAKYVVNTRATMVEDHHDDWADSLASLGPGDLGESASWTLRRWLRLADESIYHQIESHVSAYPWTLADVAPAAPGGVQLIGKGPRATHHGAECEGRRSWRFRNDFNHNRVIEKSYDTPFIHKGSGRWALQGHDSTTHSFRHGACHYSPEQDAQRAEERRRRRASRDVYPPARNEPTSELGPIEGKDLGPCTLR